MHWMKDEGKGLVAAIVPMAVLLVLSFAPRAAAQGGFTTVTGTITDPNGLKYACGSITAQLITAGGAAPTLNGGGFSTSTSPIQLGCPTSPGTGAPGSFVMRLADSGVIVPSNTTWKFTVNMTPGIAPPAGTGPQSFSVTTAINCSTNTPAVCTSNQMDISAILSAAAPALSNSAGAGAGFPVNTTVNVNNLGNIAVNSGGVIGAAPGSTGQVNGNNVTQLPNGNGIYVSPTCPVNVPSCFAVFADAQFVSDAVYTAGSPTVTTPGADPPFACPGSAYPCSVAGPGSDVGKVVFGSFNCADSTDGPCTRNLPQGTIVTVNSAHSITASTNAINTSGSGSLGATDCPLLWGHDDGAQLAAATAALVANARNGPSANLTLPCGNMMTGTPPFILETGSVKFGAYGISGCGGAGTMIIPLPLMNCTGGGAAGCLISDAEHGEGSGQVQEGAHFRDITFYGGGVNVKDPAATITAGTSGIRISFWDELENVWILGWLWNAPATTPTGITNSGGAMINSGTYAAGNPGCALQGDVNTVATMHAGSCGASGGDGLVIIPNPIGGTGASSQAETTGVYFNVTSIGGANAVHNNGGMWSDHGSHVSRTFLSDNANSISYLNGTELNQSGGGSSTLTVSNGLVHLNLVNIQATGGPINQTGGSIFDDCGNSINGTATAPTITTLYGSCSITGIADVAANHVLTSGWGTANVNTVTGSVNDVRFTISVTAGVPAAGPVLTDTFAVPYWATPSGGCSLIQEGGTFGILTNPVPSALTRTGITWTFTGTPVATQSYTFVRHCANS